MVNVLGFLPNDFDGVFVEKAVTKYDAFISRVGFSSQEQLAISKLIFYFRLPFRIQDALASSVWFEYCNLIISLSW